MRKKISLFSLLTTLFVSIMTILGTSNVNATTVNDVLYVDKSYTFDVATTKYNDLGAWVIGHENPIRRRSDHQPVYCLEAHVHFNDNSNVVGYDDDGSHTNLSKLSFEDRQRVFNIAYYGYGYGNHTSMDWYAATQLLIWEITDRNNATPYPIEPGDRSLTRSSRYDAMMNEINFLVNHDHQTVSFNNQKITANVGDTMTLTDTNGVLSQFFNVQTTGDVQASINDNTLSITANKKFHGTINLIPKTGIKPLIYDGANQKVASRGDPRRVQARINLDFYGGDVEVQKVDKDTKLSTPQGEATLKDAVYDVFNANTNEIVTTITTDANGYIKSGELPGLGRYYLKEKVRSNGYLLDETKYFFELSKDSVHASATVYEKVVENRISILKQYDYVDENTTLLNAESNIEFEIYNNKNEIVKTIKTDKNGYASTTLPYGTYKFHQVNTNTGFEKIYDFYVVVDYDSEKEQYYNILNNKLSAYLQVVKVDAETGKTIAIADTTFKILNTDTNQYVSQYVAGKVYSEFKTDETGKFITYLKLEAGNYKLIEIANPKGYVINEDGIDFTIGDGTKYTFTNYGAITTVNFKNNPIKGEIDIIKNGEFTTIVDDSYNYTLTRPLKDIKFGIYADEDIKTADGNYLFYRKGDLIATVITDENGHASSKKLPLGKYFVVELENNSDYVLDTTEHHVELKEIDNKTSIVYSTVEVTNIIKKGGLDFTKTDLTTEKVIPGVTIEIYTEDDSLIYTGTTDKNGKITIDDLFVGKFYIVEKEPATGYKLSDEKVFFEIKENGEIIKANMTNEKIKGNLEFTKINPTGEALPGTLIEIYNEDNQLVFSGKTNNDGKITVENLEYGKYYIIEKEAPEGYELSTEKIFFEIKDDKEVVKVTMTNEKSIVEVPDTRMNDNHVTEILGMILIILGIGGILYVKKNK